MPSRSNNSASTSERQRSKVGNNAYLFSHGVGLQEGFTQQSSHKKLEKSTVEIVAPQLYSINLPHLADLLIHHDPTSHEFVKDYAIIPHRLTFF